MCTCVWGGRCVHVCGVVGVYVCVGWVGVYMCVGWVGVYMCVGW